MSTHDPIPRHPASHAEDSPSPPAPLSRNRERGAGGEGLPAGGEGYVPAHGERSTDSIAWKINSEIVLLLGWNPAILLQIAHPLVAAGVTDHSLFLTDPAGRPRRLWRTLQ